MLINKDRKLFFLSTLFFVLITTIIITSWFRYGYLYGGGDVGLPSYDPTRIFEITKNIWWEAAAPGTTVPHGLTSVPLQFAQAILQDTGLSYVAIQAILFWLLLFMMGYGMFLVGLSVFGNQKIGLAILAGLFYMFNPYMMIQVWHRFVHTTFFLAAALPFIFLFWRSWIKKGTYQSLFLFLLINFLAVYLYGTLAFIATILIILVFISLFEILFPWNGFYTLRIISLRFIIGFVFWVLIHSWWMLPSFNVAPAIFSTQHTVGENLTTLYTISQQAIIPYSLLGINPFYIYEQLDWGKIYESPFFRFLPWLSLLFLVPGFIKSLTKKGLLIWSILLSVGLFLAKGAAAPFGYIYIFGFSNFFTLGILRNPYEKLGILIPFSMSILLAIGISWYLETVKYKFKSFLKVGIGFLLVILVGVNLWPMWLGKMFGKYDNPAFIDVPASYTSADDFIKRQDEEGKILHLPLTSGESATYDWKFGYNGVEPSQLLFKSLPSISHGFNLDYVDDALVALSSIFTVKPPAEREIAQLLQAFNVRFIVLHKDIEWKGGSLHDPVKIEAILNSLSFVERKAEFGRLVVYQLKDDFFGPRIRFAENISYLIRSEKSEVWPWLLKREVGDILSFTDRGLQESIVLPEETYLYRPYKVAEESVLDELPAVRFLPDSPLYSLIKLKEKVLLFTMPESDRFAFRITLAGKRLVEAYRLKEKENTKVIDSVLSDYQKLLPSLKDEIIARGGVGLAGGQIPLESIFAQHVAILEKLILKAYKDEKKIVEDTVNKLDMMLKESNLMPYYQIKESEQFPETNRSLSKFNLLLGGSYELLQAHQNSYNFYPDKLLSQTFQIDNEVENLSGKIDDHFISYGFVDLSEGLHEISFHSEPSFSLFKFPDDLIKAGQKADISPVTGGGWYQLKFDYWIKLGNQFKVQLIQDTDLAEDEKSLDFNKEFTKNIQRVSFNSYSVDLKLRPTTTLASIRFLVSPSASVVFRNVSVTRLLRNPIFLRMKSPAQSEKLSKNSVQFLQDSPVSYHGKIEVETPGFLIFSETFHPGWQLILNDDKGKYRILPMYLANLFASSWYIENKGNYTFTIEFTPQRLVKY
ncbi:MAG: alpha-(1-_3)-arabinofuranosyltransferase family protein, partial [Nanoarchaeota archaeon]